jgi:lipid-A-disaccharide synthase
LKSVFAGHPLVDTLAAEAGQAETPREMELVGLFPGSRQREVRNNFPTMLAAAKELRRVRPHLRFAVAAASDELAGPLAVIRREMGWSESDCPIGLRDSRRLMRRAGAGMVASGTATVEAACLGMPLTIVYRVSELTYWVARTVVKVPHLGMINLLAKREIAREFLQTAAQPWAIAAEVERLLEDKAARARQLEDLREVASRLGSGGASKRAAEAVLATLDSTQPPKDPFR